DNEPERVDDLLQRMALYDTGEMLLKRWQAPATVDVTSEPPGAEAQLEKYVEDERGYLRAEPQGRLGVTPLQGLRLGAGSYRITLRAPGREDVLYPVMLARGEALRIDVPMPKKGSLPPGFVYIPPGRFFMGTAGQELLRSRFFNTAPGHPVWTDAYLIARTEVTFADYIPFLESLPVDKREPFLPKVGSGAGGVGAGMVSLSLEAGGHWRLTLQPGSVAHTALDTEPLVFSGRQHLRSQVWQRFPVVGIDATAAQAYAAWLASTGKLPGARLCTEFEWERGARGGDLRMYATGQTLGPSDANYDQTFGKKPDGIGPVEVGALPLSTSPFGLVDMTGNITELTVGSLAPNEYVLRGGPFGFEEATNRLENRNPVDAGFRVADGGVRLCSSVVAR
ncbi:MAG TPA: SUMF1/EgtB/PvdO family nonheme iron enzyme, partial [Pseudomonadota bacterium]|nr:SUMF1/EgtB/PvdO family nonheme iron enzyme [Pseudomonadota bacterium]